ncbi:hypothetical protein [Sulfurimonas hydrogeniphila]|uniref:hypothetical protein n=1 Tax=Sulfurimonas hydrogeniphila TaxID=2509341 RepID=UPI00125F72FA|nr:hypothetical protein [Sulfurimonas hydrogeniphila]
MKLFFQNDRKDVIIKFYIVAIDERGIGNAYAVFIIVLSVVFKVVVGDLQFESLGEFFCKMYV